MKILLGLPPPNRSQCLSRSRSQRSTCSANLQNCTSSMCFACSSLEGQGAVTIHVHKAFASKSIAPVLCAAWKLVPPEFRASDIPQCELGPAASPGRETPSDAHSVRSTAKPASLDCPDSPFLSRGCELTPPEVESHAKLAAEPLGWLPWRLAIPVHLPSRCSPRVQPRSVCHLAVACQVTQVEPSLLPAPRCSDSKAQRCFGLDLCEHLLSRSIAPPRDRLCQEANDC